MRGGRPGAHDVVDLAILDGKQKLEEPVSAHRRAALTFVVEAFDKAPALGSAMRDEGLAVLRLELARRDGWVDASARHGLPRVDGAANGLANGPTGRHEGEKCS